ncbi:recombinase RecA [Anaeromyxobacter diazotrophicus]|uniref:Protein RecA n=1 Tax=Anaeromyxobacter diazotrophicus TaxID=2590199 RepID=A0A7I9VL82_9BACT|nr:recombinase RecA [Anaeromyxobacter diazotrophicus]GEJ56948.1 protein RecA [Anaeromyxobacter diazotrophicus]
MSKLGEKVKALGAAVAAIEKQFGKGSIMRLGEQEETPRIAVVSSGSIGLDLALGVGGYPRGRVIEIFGPESSGKTTLALHAIAEVQKAGGVAAFIDAEHALDVTYARRLGVNLADLLVSQPDTGEQALEIAEQLVRSGAVDLIVVDSVAALVPKAEIEGEMGDAHMGVQARLMSQALRKLTAVVSRNASTVVFINQIRMKIGVVFGNPETTTGGHALKFYASVRLDIRRIGQLKEGEQVVGSRTRVKVVKNKVAPPFREAEFDIRYGVGVDRLAEAVDLGVERNLVEKSGAFYALGGERMGQGRERAVEWLKANPAALEALVAKLALPPEPLAVVRASA